MDHELRREELADVKPARAILDDHEAPTGFLPMAQRIILPGILAASVALGALGGTLTPARSTTTSAAAEPVAVRTDAPDTSRDAAREAIEPAASPTPEESVTPEAAPAPAAAPLQALPAAAPASATSAAPTTTKAAAPEVTGSMFATETVNVRAEASASSDKVASLAQGDKVGVTDKAANGFQQVVVDGRAGWVSAQYLAKSAPAPSAAASKSSSPSASSKSADAPVASGACKPLSGVTANAEKVHQAICAKFGSGVSSYIGVRPDGDVEHPSGRAVDAMITSGSTGQAIADYMRANASSLGVTEVIYNHRIWTTQRASEGWRSMSDRGSATANHEDHVHISVR